MQRIARHATRLAAANDSDPESDFSVGQRVVADGFGGVVSAVEPGYARGSETYTVTLDGGMGGGDYSAGQLRTAAWMTEDQARQAWRDSPEARVGLRAEDVLAAQASGVHVASEDYPEMGTILFDRPDPGRQVTVIGSLRREAADGSVYHGKNYYLPHSLYNHVTDPSRPVHERGHALARYLAGYPHNHGGMGIEWTDDASAAMGSAHYQGDNPWNVKDGAEPSGEHDWGVPVVYHAAPHDEFTHPSEHEGIPHEAFNGYDSGSRERIVRPGSPVRWTGVSWSEQPGSEESRSRDPDDRPRAPEEADASHWRHFRFPEGIQVKASLRREAAWYDEGEPHAHELGGSVYRGMPVYLPTDLHRKVHDESRPVHERALLLARHVMANQPRWANGGVGTSWSNAMHHSPLWQATTQEPHYDEHVEADHAYGRLARDHTPVILHARTPGPEHRDEDQEALHRRDREGDWLGDDDYDPEPSEYPLRGNLHVKEGHPVGLSGISWARAGHSGQERPEGSPAWHHHEFPEPVTVKASLRPRTALRWIAADQNLELS